MLKQLIATTVAVLVAGTAGLAVAQVDPYQTAKPAVEKVAVAKPAITAEQRARLAEKLRLINQAMTAVDGDRSGALTSESRRWLLESMYKMSLEQVRMVGVPGSYNGTADAVSRVQKISTKVLGSRSLDLTYTPFAPCRYIDTRNVGGKINGTRGFDTANAGTTYGGSASCVPTTLANVTDENDIGAIAMNITIVDTSGAASPGFATVRPAGATALTALVNWTTSSAGFQLGNAAVVSTDQSSLTNEFEILTSGSVHAIVDFFGAFVSPAATALDCTTTAANATYSNNGTTNSTANIVNTITVPACPAGYTFTSVIADFNVDGSDITGSCNETDCRIYTGHSHAFAGISARCCRVPGR